MFEKIHKTIHTKGLISYAVDMPTWLIRSLSFRNYLTQYLYMITRERAIPSRAIWGEIIFYEI